MVQAMIEISSSGREEYPFWEQYMLTSILLKTLCLLGVIPRIVNLVDVVKMCDRVYMSYHNQRRTEAHTTDEAK